jgi:hypothetical protein
VLLFALYLITIPAVYYLASRFVSPLPAVVGCALALIWNVPVYPAAMPSWYNLLFALLGAAALVRYAETHRRAWILVAGMLGGLSCTMKITGLFFVAGSLLWILFVAQERAVKARSPGDRSPATTVLHLFALLAFGAAVLVLIRPRLTAAEGAYFLLPIAALIALLARRELRARAAGMLVVTPWSEFALLMTGLAIPLLTFSIPYLTSGSLDALLRGVFLAPVGRISGAAVRPPAPGSVVAAAPLALALYAVLRLERLPPALLALAAAGLGAALYWSDVPFVFAPVVASMRWVPVVATMGAVIILWEVRPTLDMAEGQGGRNADRPGQHRQSTLFLLAALTATVSLIQYPFAHPIYLWFVAPIAALTLVAMVGNKVRAKPALLGLFALFYIAFSIQQLQRLPTTVPLDIPRASLFVPYPDKVKFERVVALLQEHAGSDYIWAGPDTPEIYYLAGLRNPTRHLFEFLAQNSDRETEILTGIERHQVNAIALNHDHYFSDLSEGLEKEFVRRFPHSERIGNIEVRWREGRD